ncbi:hypothetical protein AMK31_35975 [Streptomyces sp. TSRI0107]|nr:hypothetical protein AMK31_35975 [Streptomyces sp. TSRI0107]
MDQADCEGLWAALLGFAVAGLGLANLFPVAVERAGALAGPGGVAVASTLGYGGMLIGPPAIGFMADWRRRPHGRRGRPGVRVG